VSFEADFLVEIAGEGAELVEGGGDLGDGFVARDFLVEVVGEDADAGGADVGAELDEALGVFDGGFDFGGIGEVEAFAVARPTSLTGLSAKSLRTSRRRQR